jgi:membrane protease YdiL (CAAX protease family)
LILTFATLHLSLLFQGMSGIFVAGIFLNTLLLGLLAGYLREKTGSLYPSIYVHILFNIVGSLPLLLQLLVGM